MMNKNPIKCNLLVEQQENLPLYQWIDVDDRLPEFVYENNNHKASRKVLVTDGKDIKIGINYYYKCDDSFGWETTYRSPLFDIIAWKKLPEHEERIKNLLEAFPLSYINKNNEFIAFPETNAYFSLNDCDYCEDIDCKVLEYLSREAAKSMHYNTEEQNLLYQGFMRANINQFLHTCFSREDMEKIYQRLGNGINHKLTMEFVISFYDKTILDN